ncbi:hypothetical protein FB45DRAFT_734655 [Roridomyces roridus]|uniref:DUF7918 domain-containing protein n=1 Tax=Roridomyces roridus TaxID=1738132 RepID=A0AAD7CE32_9AGAR|nr:hypothetical protein FB45DRAFT_734655 [Roridomyces roridus]
MFFWDTSGHQRDASRVKARRQIRCFYLYKNKQTKRFSPLCHHPHFSMLQSLDRSFGAWITIDGLVTPEYNVETSADGKTVTCWIASELGKKFAVHWTNTGYAAHVEGQVKMDGISCGGKITSAGGEQYSSGPASGLHLVSTRQFSPAHSSTCLDDDALLGGPSYEHLGLIELTLHPVQIMSYNVPCNGTHNLSNLKVHERSKKAVTQQITLAAPIMQQTNFVQTTRLGADLVTFTFKYRPLDILQANGIAPVSSWLKRKSSDEESSSKPVLSVRGLRSLEDSTHPFSRRNATFRRPRARRRRNRA